jgi:hypothetical protein
MALIRPRLSFFAKVCFRSKSPPLLASSHTRPLSSSSPIAAAIFSSVTRSVNDASPTFHVAVTRVSQ